MFEVVEAQFEASLLLMHRLIETGVGNHDGSIVGEAFGQADIPALSETCLVLQERQDAKWCALGQEWDCQHVLANEVRSDDLRPEALPEIPFDNGLSGFECPH